MATTSSLPDTTDTNDPTTRTIHASQRASLLSTTLAKAELLQVELKKERERANNSERLASTLQAAVGEFKITATASSPPKDTIPSSSQRSPNLERIVQFFQSRVERAKRERSEAHARRAAITGAWRQVIHYVDSVDRTLKSIRVAFDRIVVNGGSVVTPITLPLPAFSSPLFPPSPSMGRISGLEKPLYHPLQTTYASHDPSPVPLCADTCIVRDEVGPRLCCNCGKPGRYNGDKCIEKWGPGPCGPGTFCDKCRKKVRREEAREERYAKQQQQQGPVQIQTYGPQPLRLFPVVTRPLSSTSTCANDHLADLSSASQITQAPPRIIRPPPPLSPANEHPSFSYGCDSPFSTSSGIDIELPTSSVRDDAPEQRTI